MSNNSSTKPKSLHDFYQSALEVNEEVAARFHHAFNVNVQLKKENLSLRDRIDALISDNRDLREKIETLREVGNNYISQLEVRVADSQQERDALLIRVGYLERTIEQLKGETK